MQILQISSVRMGIDVSSSKACNLRTIGHRESGKSDLRTSQIHWCVAMVRLWTHYSVTHGGNGLPSALSHAKKVYISYYDQNRRNSSITVYFDFRER